MPQGTRISNIHADATVVNRVEADIDRKVFDYFFRHCLAGERGPRQAMICFFFQRFYEACILEGIAPVFDEDNEERLNNVMQRLNFSNVTGLPRNRKPKSGSASVN